MKKFIICVAILLTATIAFAGFKGFNSSDTQVGIFSELKCGTNISCSQVSGKFYMEVVSLALTGAILGDGSASLSGMLQAQVASTTASLTIAQCGSTIVSDSADVIVLPEASTALGCRYTFVCGTDDDFDVNPADGTDVIGITGSITGSDSATVLAPSAGDALRCTDVGAGFVLEAVAADLWAVLSTNGIITDVN